MYLSKREIKRYEELKKQIAPLKDKLRSFADDYVDYVSNRYIDTPYGKMNLFHTRDRYDDYIEDCFIKDDIVYIYIGDLGGFSDDPREIKLPVSILYDENWRNTIVTLTYEKEKALLKKKAEKEKKLKEEAKAKREAEERKVYELLKKKFGDNNSS